MATRQTQQAENFDSTAKQMLEALAKASVELEKSVSTYTEHLISFSDSLAKSFEEELRAVSRRFDYCVKSNLEDLLRDKEALMKQLSEAERAEVEAILAAGRDVRSTLAAHSSELEAKIAALIETRMQELRTYLEEPERQIRSASDVTITALKTFLDESVGSIDQHRDEAEIILAEKLGQVSGSIVNETDAARSQISRTLSECQEQLRGKTDGLADDLTSRCEETIEQLNQKSELGLDSVKVSKSTALQALDRANDNFKEQVGEVCDNFDSSLLNLSTVLREAYETKLANVGAQAKNELGELTHQAQEKIRLTRSELEVSLRALEREYLEKLETLLKRLETYIGEHNADLRYSGIARQHKDQKLRDQLQTHLKRWGAGLTESVRSASETLLSDFVKSTDGFNQRIESTKASAVELLERESRMMAKEVERTMKEFQKQCTELESQLEQIEKAGRDAEITVVAYRKAMLSFGSD